MVSDDTYRLNWCILGKQKGELPAGRPVAAALKFQDPDIEKELNELRQKAKEY